MSASHGWEMQYGAWDGGFVENTRQAAKRAYAEAGVRDPRARHLADRSARLFLDHRTRDDGGPRPRGRRPRAASIFCDGRFDRDGAQPCQIDGGLKCFGHPVGASGLRMAFEVYTQLLGRAGARQLGKVDLGLTHNLGGAPFNSVAAVSIFGRLN